MVTHRDDVHELLEQPSIGLPPVRDDVLEHGEVVAEQPEHDAECDEGRAEADLFYKLMALALASCKDARNAVRHHQDDAGKENIRVAEHRADHPKSKGHSGSDAPRDRFSVSEEVDKESEERGHEREAGDVRVHGAKREELPRERDERERREGAGDDHVLLAWEGRG